MPGNSPKSPLSPTVATVFTNFLQRLEADKVIEQPALEALQKALEQQDLDPASLRTSIFGLSTGS